MARKAHRSRHHTSARVRREREGIRSESTEFKGRPQSTGFNEQEQKWYGWSHRARYGFGVGDKVTKDSVIAHHFPVGHEAKTLDDARQMAAAFAEAVS
jgi:hypothetical protein